MAQQTRRRIPVNDDIHYYVEGNVVRKEEPVYEPFGESREQVKKRVRRNRARARQMSVPYVVMLSVAMIISVFICYQTLMLKAEIVASKQHIVTLQNQLDSLRLSNNAIEGSVAIYTDLDHIYKVATEEMGMVYPSEDQVIRFDRTESEYVRQYEDIPTDD
ncbi:MAG: cell division protein FtsL [Lachnospiraceae bacterium]|nr:cell division protein FtsL [Lachnospiraceae bacterium]